MITILALYMHAISMDCPFFMQINALVALKVFTISLPLFCNPKRYKQNILQFVYQFARTTHTKHALFFYTTFHIVEHAIKGQFGLLYVVYII